MVPLKTIVIIFSFVLLSVFSIGNCLIYLVYLKNYKKDFKQYINTNQKELALSVISINPSELYCNSPSVIWEDDNKEVVHKGKLYDVVNINSNGLEVKLTVVSDEQEMELKNQFASFYNIDSHATTKGPFSLLKTFLSLKFIVNTIELELKPTEINSVSYFSPPSFQLSYKAISNDSPPPDAFM